MSEHEAGETQTFIAFLDAQREHVLGILEGLSEDELRRPVLASGWTCAGLVNHLALDVERFWFQDIIAGAGAGQVDDDSANAWTAPADMTSQEIFARYRDEISRANEIISRTSPDAAPLWWPSERWGSFRLDTVREVVLHVIAETAVHAGHLDAVRELIDGRQWLVLT